MNQRQILQNTKTKNNFLTLDDNLEYLILLNFSGVDRGNSRVVRILFLLKKLQKSRPLWPSDKFRGVPVVQKKIEKLQNPDQNFSRSVSCK